MRERERKKNTNKSEPNRVIRRKKGSLDGALLLGPQAESDCNGRVLRERDDAPTGGHDALQRCLHEATNMHSVHCKCEVKRVGAVLQLEHQLQAMRASQIIATQSGEKSAPDGSFRRL